MDNQNHLKSAKFRVLSSKKEEVSQKAFREQVIAELCTESNSYPKSRWAGW